MWIQIRLFLQEQPNLGRLRLSKKLPNISADDKSFNGDLSTCAVGGQWLSGRVLDSRSRGRRHCVVVLE